MNFNASDQCPFEAVHVVEISLVDEIGVERPDDLMDGDTQTLACLAPIENSRDRPHVLPLLQPIEAKCVVTAQPTRRVIHPDDIIMKDTKGSLDVPLVERAIELRDQPNF